MQHVWERVEVYTGVWWRNVRERVHLEEPGIDGRKLLGQMFWKWDVGTLIRSMCFSVWTGGEHL